MVRPVVAGVVTGVVIPPSPTHHCSRPPGRSPHQQRQQEADMTEQSRPRPEVVWATRDPVPLPTNRPQGAEAEADMGNHDHDEETA